MLKYAILTLIACNLLFFLGCKHAIRATKASSTPQSITAQDLITKGPGNNAHIKLTNYHPLPEHSILYYKDKKRESRYRDVLIPLIPASHPYAIASAKKTYFRNLPELPKNVHIIVHSNYLKDDGYVKRFHKKTSFTGMLTKDLSSLNELFVKDLKQTLTQTDFNNVYVILHKRKPNSLFISILSFTFGIIFLVISLFLFSDVIFNHMNNKTPHIYDIDEIQDTEDAMLVNVLGPNEIANATYEDQVKFFQEQKAKQNKTNPPR